MSVNKHELYDLTHPQTRIWYMEKVYLNTPIYNIGGTIDIPGELQYEVLDKAVNLQIQHNEVLRTKFIVEEGKPKQYISEYHYTPVEYKDFSMFPNGEEKFNEWKDREIHTAFLLEEDLLFKVAYVKLSSKHSIVLLKFHHIIMDGWGISLFTNQMTSYYTQIINNVEIVPVNLYDYRDFGNDEERYLQSKQAKRDQIFWQEKYANLKTLVLERNSNTTVGKRKRYDLKPEISKQIQEYCTQKGYMPNVFFIAVYLLWMNKTLQSNELVINTPILNRYGKKQKGALGMFTGTLPFKFSVDEDESLEEMLLRIKRELAPCYYHSKYPYDLLVKDIQLKQEGYDELFSSCVNYYNSDFNATIGEIPVEYDEFYNGNQAYAFQLIIKEWAKRQCFTLEMDYKVDTYSDKYIERMYKFFMQMIKQVLENAEVKINEIDLLTACEKNELLNVYNDTQANYPLKTIQTLFEEQVEKTPQHIALSHVDQAMTYRELNDAANRVAHYLAHYVVPGSKVTIIMEHSFEAVIAILGVLKARCTYIPIDPAYPNERIKYIIQDAKAHIVLTNLESISTMALDCKVINLKNVDLTNEEITNTIPGIMEDSAYIIYTSGSTGKPKGVVIQQKGLVNYIYWANKMYVKQQEIFALYSSFSFDLTVTSIFTPLISGNTIRIYDNYDTEYVIYRIVKENQVTVLKLTPAQLSLVKDMEVENSKLRCFIVGGEALKTDLANQIYCKFRNIEIYNEYGPTEATVGCMIHKYDLQDIDTDVPIGRPADNVQIYVLDHNLKPCLKNMIGEMYIGGDGLAKEYLNLPDMTKKSFIKNPFDPQKRLYKTGDLAYFTEQGILQYIGRSDFQVKINGYRIELSEIEQVLIKHEAIKDAVVLIQEHLKNQYIFAYIVWAKEMDIQKLKADVAQYLPEYMIPTYFIALDEIPLTNNGKVDREALNKIKWYEDETIVAATNQIEAEFIDVLKSVFNAENIGIKSNFYHIGGDSIKAIQVASKLSSRGVKIKINNILKHPVIEEMCLYAQLDKREINSKSVEGEICSTPITRWFFNKHFSNPNYYTQSMLLELEDNIKVETLEYAFDQIIRQHDILNANYDYKTEQLFYNHKNLDSPFKIPVYVVDDINGESIVDMANQLRQEIDLEKGRLIRSCIFEEKHQKRKLFITMHHLIIDGISWRIILEDLNNLLRDSKYTFPFKTTSYQEWANSLTEYQKQNQMDQDFWQEMSESAFCFPVDFNISEDNIASKQMEVGILDKAITAQILTTATKKFHIKTHEILEIAIFIALKKITAQEDFVIELEHHGREAISELIDTTRTVGWFTSLYPVRVKLKEHVLADQIKSIKEDLRRIKLGGITFNGKVEKGIRFNYLGEFEQEFEQFKLLNEFIGEESDKTNLLTYLIEVNAYVIDKGLNICVSYSKNRFKCETIKLFMQTYMETIKEIVSLCCESDISGFTPSDFETIDISQDTLDSLFE